MPNVLTVLDSLLQRLLSIIYKEILNNTEQNYFLDYTFIFFLYFHTYSISKNSSTRVYIYIHIFPKIAAHMYIYIYIWVSPNIYRVCDYCQLCVVKLLLTIPVHMCALYTHIYIYIYIYICISDMYVGLCWNFYRIDEKTIHAYLVYN